MTQPLTNAKAEWDRDWTERAGGLVPKCLVSLDNALSAASDIVRESREKKDDRTALQAISQVRQIVDQMLTYLCSDGAASSHPSEIHEQGIRGLMLSRGMTREDAETHWAEITCALNAGVESVAEDL